MDIGSSHDNTPFCIPLHLHLCLPVLFHLFLAAPVTFIPKLYLADSLSVQQMYRWLNHSTSTFPDVHFSDYILVCFLIPYGEFRSVVFCLYNEMFMHTLAKQLSASCVKLAWPITHKVALQRCIFQRITVYHSPCPGFSSKESLYITVLVQVSSPKNHCISQSLSMFLPHTWK
jgi:hypothetical protein